jgi:hypothetical protein
MGFRVPNPEWEKLGELRLLAADAIQCVQDAVTVE